MGSGQGEDYVRGSMYTNKLQRRADTQAGRCSQQLFKYEEVGERHPEFGGQPSVAIPAIQGTLCSLPMRVIQQARNHYCSSVNRIAFVKCYE